MVSATVNLRDRPGTDSEVITTIRAGSTVRVADCSGEWCVVVWDKYSGYATARNLSLGASRQARAYPAKPRYPDDYELEPPVQVVYGHGPPGYDALPAGAYGRAYYPAYYYGPRVYYGPGWTSPAIREENAFARFFNGLLPGHDQEKLQDNRDRRDENAFTRFFNGLLPGHDPEKLQDNRDRRDENTFARIFNELVPGHDPGKPP